LLEHGFLDAIVERKDLKGYLVQALSWMEAEQKSEAVGA
jgi:acetyl-CoA carboxylase carboxyl transferase subunit beta